MKLIHLSDLHIGKRLGDYSMLEDQAYILNQILGMIDAEAPQAVAIAGDVYDKSVPITEAVTMFDDFLFCLAQRKMQVFIISGNHDSPERLAFGGRLMEKTGIHLSPVYGGSVTPVTLTDEYGEVDFWLLPFIKPATVRRYYPDAGIESYQDACRVALEAMGMDKTRRNVLVTHQFVTGAEVGESEEFAVGGTDNVDADLFGMFDYVALGHIHKPQDIDSQRIRYCGTPLKYSLSEAEQVKSVTVVELGEKGNLTVRTLPLTPKRELRQIRGTFAQLTDRAFYAGTATDDYLYVVLTDEEDVPEAVGRLRQIYPNIMKLSYDNTRTREERAVNRANIQKKSAMELFGELYQDQNNQPMSQVQREFVEALLREIEEEMQ